MLIWINGAFGAGKTTLAGELKARLPGVLDYDPEYVGYLLTKWVPAPDAAGVPLLHVFLDVPADEVRRRIVEQEVIDGVPQADDMWRFRLRNVDRCVAARADLPADTLVLDAGRHTPEQLADLVRAQI